MSGKVSASIQNARPRVSITLVDAIVDSEQVVARADHSRVVPVARTSQVIPVVATTHTIPATEISYISLYLDAVLDNTGLFRYVAESVVLTDGRVFSFTKLLSNSIGINDTKSINSSLAKTDSVSVADIFEALLIFIRNFQDTISLSESVTKTISPAYFETVHGTDSIALTFEKYLSDSFSLNDLSDVNGTTISFADYTNNVISMTDAKFLSSSKILTESISANDSGYLLSQNYCDITYFAEDYVGQYRTF